MIGVAEEDLAGDQRGQLAAGPGRGGQVRRGDRRQGERDQEGLGGGRHVMLLLGGTGADAGGKARVASQGNARLIVRHLLLPGHAACCYEPVARWVLD